MGRVWVGYYKTRHPTHTRPGLKFKTRYPTQNPFNIPIPDPNRPGTGLIPVLPAPIAIPRPSILPTHLDP